MDIRFTFHFSSVRNVNSDYSKKGHLKIMLKGEGVICILMIKSTSIYITE